MRYSVMVYFTCYFNILYIFLSTCFCFGHICSVLRCAELLVNQLFVAKTSGVY